MENTICIQNLSRNADVWILCEKFHSCGRILSANIEYNNEKIPLGKAYITFADYASASNSIKMFHHSKIIDKYIEVSLAVEKKPFKKIFVKNVSPVWDEYDLCKAFERFGTIEEAKVQKISCSYSYGFITFKTHAAAKQAIKSLNGKKFDGFKIVVERFKDLSEIESEKQGSLEHAERLLENTTQRNNLFVKNLAKDIDDDELYMLFEQYGEILSCIVALDERRQSKGHGFVCFKNVEDAEEALNARNGYFLHGKHIQINFKQDKNARQHYMKLKNKESSSKVEDFKQRSQSTSVLSLRPAVGRRTLLKI